MSIDTDNIKPNSTEDLDAVKKAAASLMDRFDAVQIIAGRHNEDDRGSIMCDHGRGNWYTRFGMVKSWIIKQEEFERENSK